MTLQVLIVEDSEIHLEANELALRTLDAQQKELVGISNVEIDLAVCASEARALLERAAQAKQPYDLLLLDLSLPEQRGADDKPEHGLKLIELARAQEAAKLVIVSSAFANFDQYAALAFERGIDDLLSKPYSKIKLQKSVLAGLQARLPAQGQEAGLVESLQETIRGQSRPHLKALQLLARVIPNPSANVLLLGESGTGKELFARAISERGPRAKRPFVAVNVAAIPPTLIERELFGHERGTFTDAKERRPGYFENAQDGTLFLDEIGDLELSLQAKLLRVIDTKRFTRLGGQHEQPFHARLICATQPGLRAAVNLGVFRKDLFYRISTVTIDLPPLRDRRGDVELLLHYFLNHLRGKRPVSFATDTLEFFRRYRFPGNVRELKNIVESALNQCDGEDILLRHLPWANMNLAAETAPEPDEKDAPEQDLFSKLTALLPDGWQELPYKETRKLWLEALERAFDQLYLPPEWARHQYNVSQLAPALGIDKKTFYTRWRNAGLPPLN